MNIGELFINLKVTGGSAAAAQINVTGKALGEVKKMAIETKATILAALYATNKLLRAPVEFGAGYASFTRATGVAAKSLQQIQVELNKTGTSFEQTKGIVSGFSERIQSYQFENVAIKGLLQIQRRLAAAGINMVNDTELTPELLAEYFRIFTQLKDVSLAERNVVGKEFGLTPDQVSSFYRAKKFSGVNVPDLVTDKQAKELEKTAAKLEEVERKIKTMFSDFVAENGESIATGILEISKSLKELVGVLLGLGTALGLIKKEKGKDGFILDSLKGSSWFLEKTNELIKGMNKDPDFLKKNTQKKFNGIAPNVKSTGSPAQHSSNLNQTINISGNVNDPKEVSNAVAKETRAAFRMNAAQYQVV